MTTAVTGTTIFTQPSNGAGTVAGWLGDAWNSIQASNNSAGILGALASSKNADGSISSFLNNSSALSNSFALIAQGNTSAFTSLFQQEATNNAQQAQADKLQKSLNASQAALAAPPGPKLDSMIFFGNGSTLDTVNNILTLADGTQLDSTTGIQISSDQIMQLGNGAYLDTTKNIMTLSDGTQVDVTTGQTIATSA